VAQIGETRNAHTILVEKLNGRNNVGDKEVDGKIILKYN
jgi:hypothetical protein